jgi:hypothetical protein
MKQFVEGPLNCDSVVKCKEPYWPGLGAYWATCHSIVEDVSKLPLHDFATVSLGRRQSLVLLSALLRKAFS